MPTSTLFFQKLLRWLMLFFFCLTTAHTAQAQLAEVLPGAPNANVQKIVIDLAGNMTIAGSFQGTLTIGTTTLTSQGQEDLFVARRSAAGMWEWAVAGGGGIREFLHGLVLLPTGDVCIAGKCNAGSTNGGVSATFGNTTLANDQTFLARLTPSGQWASVNGLNLRNGGTINAIALEPASGDVLVGGDYAGTNVVIGSRTFPGFSVGCFAGLLSADGQWRWIEPVRSTGVIHSMGTVSSDGNGGVIITDYFSDSITFGATTLRTVTYDGIFIAHLTAGRTWQWAQSIESLSNYEEITNHTVDAAGNIYLTGYFAGHVQFGVTGFASIGMNNDLFVAKLNAQGQWQWAKQLGSFGNDFGTSVCVDNTGTVYVGGTFSDSLFVGPRLAHAGGTDGVVLRFDTNGTPQAAAAMSGTGDDQATALALDPSSGHLVAGGTFGSPTLTIDPSHTLIHNGSSGSNSSFVADISSQLLGTPPAAAALARLTLSPNPAHGALWLNLPATTAPTTATLLDGVGRAVRSFPLTGERTRLDIQGLAPGVYTVRVGAQTRRLVVE